MNRVLSVTSERSAFPEDAVDAAAPPLASTSATTLDMTLGLVGQGLIRAPIPPSSSASPSPSASPIATRRPSASPSLSGSPRSSPQVVPLLSPIPWLRSSSNKSDTQSENGDVDPLHLSSPPPPQQQHPPTALPSTAAAGSELHLDVAVPDAASHPETATPTGGLVDEVDPGSGGAETAEPVALSSAMSLSPERERSAADMTSGEFSQGAAGEGSDGAERSTASLQERFIRASSPKVEMPLDPEEADERMKE